MPHWTLSHLVPFRPKLLSPHPVLIALRHLILGVALHNKSLLMCARHSVIAMARFTHPWQRSRHCLVTIGGRHYMPRFRVHRLNNMSSRHAISGTSPPRAMSQTVLKLWCITGGQPRPLSVQIGTQWVWHGQSVIRCGMRRVPLHNADRRWLNHGHVALWNTRPLICLLHHR